MDETDEGPEFKKLSARLFNDPNHRTLNIKVSWSDDARHLSREERCRELNMAFDQIDSGQSKPLDFADSKRVKVDEFLRAALPPARTI